MTEVEFNSVLFWSFPIVLALALGVALVVWIVMAQRTKRQAIAAGMSAEQYAALASRGTALRSGVFCCGFGTALLLVGLLKLDSGSPYTWALIFLGCGGALVLNHFLLRSPKAK